MNDPRSDLEPGTYWATVTKTGITDYRTWAPFVEMIIAGSGEYLEGKDNQSWIEYSLPGCGEWRWELRSGEHGVTDEFIRTAIEKGGFTFKKVEVE